MLYLPSIAPDVRDTLTFRLDHKVTRVSSEEEDIRDAFKQAAYYFTHEAASMGEIAPSIWDISADAWEQFTSNCQAYLDSMRCLVKQAGISSGDSILDIGAGTGSTTDIIRDCVSDVRLTILDSSPQMLARAKRRFNHSAQYALCSVPGTPNERLVDITAKFDCIILHLALPSLASTPEDLTRIATWSRKWTKSGGKLALAAHNTAIRSPQSRYRPDIDPLRQALITAARVRGYEQYLKSSRSQPLDPDSVMTAFTNACYRLIGQQGRKDFKITMDDRIRMWTTPAVMNELLDLTMIPENERIAIIHDVATAVGGGDTPDINVTYWVFEAI